MLAGGTRITSAASFANGPRPTDVNRPRRPIVDESLDRDRRRRPGRRRTAQGRWRQFWARGHAIRGRSAGLGRLEGFPPNRKQIGRGVACAAEALARSTGTRGSLPACRGGSPRGPSSWFCVKALSVQVCGADQKSSSPVGELGEQPPSRAGGPARSRTMRTSSLFGNASTKVRELLKDICCVEVLPVEREDKRSLAARIKALAHRRPRAEGDNRPRWRTR